MNPTQSPAVATHTPTPYEVAYYSPDKSMGDQSAFIIMPQFGTMNDGKAICSGHGPDHKANAAFIVRACNSHAQLVAALEYVVKFSGPLAGRGTEYEMALEQAVAALSAAKQ